MSGTPTQLAHEVVAALRLEQVRYAIRDIAVVAEQLAREGKKILPLNIGDPLKFDFRTPSHVVEAVVRAMRDGHNGYAPSPGIDEAIEAVRAEAERKGTHNIQSVFITQGVSEAVDVCLTALVNPGENVLTPGPEYPLYSAILAKLGALLRILRHILIVANALPRSQHCLGPYMACAATIYPERDPPRP